MADFVSVSLPPKIREGLERLTARLVERFAGDLLEVRLYGSRARGDARPGSDVDLLIVLRDDAPEDLEERIEVERADVWRQDDEYAHLAAFVLQEKHIPVSPAERAAIEEGLRARGMTFDDLLPMLGLLVMREREFRDHQATRDLLYRNLRDEGVTLWSAGADLWNEEGIPVIGRERDVQFELDQAVRALKAAQLLLANDDPGNAAGRAYYAAFHSARASLLTENIERASHGDLIAEFNRLTKANRLLGKEFHGKLDELFKLRQEADYGRTYVKEKDARRAVQTAERFVQAAQEYCRRWLERREGPER